MSVGETSVPVALRVVRYFWVPLDAAAASLDAAARARARSVRALVRLGEHSLAGSGRDGATDDAPAACVAALASFRAALELGLPEARAVSDIESLFDGPQGASLEPDEAVRRRLRRALADEPLRDLPSLGDDALLEAATCAGGFTRRALDPLLSREASRAERLRARATRLGLLALAFLAVAIVGPGVRRALKPDLAPGARWRASSTMGPLPGQGVGFHPREGEGNFFFQTRVEPEPWIEFDLGGDRAIEAVTVQNRLDCCTDWAVPLVIEVAGASRQWRAVGRRAEPFYFYTAHFPSAPARYVRVRVPRMTSLHLGAVKIR